MHPPAELDQAAVGFSVVAAPAARDHVLPGVLATTAAWDHVIETCRRGGAIDATSAVAREHGPASERDVRAVGHLHKAGKPDDDRHMQGQVLAVQLFLAGLDRYGLARKDKDHRAAG